MRKKLRLDYRSARYNWAHTRKQRVCQLKKLYSANTGATLQFFVSDLRSQKKTQCRESRVRAQWQDDVQRHLNGSDFCSDGTERRRDTASTLRLWHAAGVPNQLFLMELDVRANRARFMVHARPCKKVTPFTGMRTVPTKQRGAFFSCVGGSISKSVFFFARPGPRSLKVFHAAALFCSPVLKAMLRLQLKSCLFDLRVHFNARNKTVESMGNLQHTPPDFPIVGTFS